MAVNVVRRPAGSEATPPSGSLEEAQSALLGILPDDGDRSQPNETQPEQQGTKSAPAPQAPAAPESESAEDDVESPAGSEAGSEQAETDEESGEQADPEPPKRYKVKANDRELEVTEDELLKGYSRTADYTRDKMQLAEERKRFETEELQAVRQERQQYAETLGQLAEAIRALQPAEPEWSTIPPEQLPQRLQEWRSTQKHLEQIQGERQRLAALEAEAQQRDLAAILQQERTKLHAAIPDLADPEKGKALEAQYVTYAEKYGWTPDELRSVPDHRLLVLLDKAMRYDQQQAKAPTIQNKIERALVTPKPGSKTTAKPRDRFAEAKNRLRDSGSTEDAAAAIAHLLD